MSQTKLLLNLLQEKQPVRTDMIVRKVYGEKLSLSRVGARIWDLKHKGHDIRGTKDPKIHSLYWYQLFESPPSLIEMKNSADIIGLTLKDYIDRFKWSPDPDSPAVQLIRNIHKPDNICCYSFKIFKSHDPNCIKAREVIKQGLF